MSSSGITPNTSNDSGNIKQGLNETKNFFLNKNVLIAIAWIVAIGIVVYLATYSFSRRDDTPEGSGALLFSRSFDIVVLLLLLIFIVYEYYSSNQKDRENILQWLFVWTRDFLNNPWGSFIETTIFAIVFYAIVFLFRIPRSPEFAPITVYILEEKIWIVYLTLFIIVFFKYVLKIPIIDILLGDQWGNFWNTLPNSSPNIFGNITGSPGSSSPGSSSPGSSSPGSNSPASDNNKNVSGSPGSNVTTTINSSGLQTTCTLAPAAPTNLEVFNIANNIYTYSDASAVCAAYGATLASYDQVEKAYTNGAEWCNYGWSKNQMAFFPTQKSTWLKYQATDDQKNDCGRPGVNGGYFDNPNLQLGVNCYGVKPKPTKQQLDAINAYKDPELPPTKVDLVLQQKLDEIRKQSNINSFKYKKWSEY
jgi:hypothetical protein